MELHIPTKTYFANLADGTYSLDSEDLQEIAQLNNEEIENALIKGAYLTTKSEMEVLLRFNGLSPDEAHTKTSMIVGGVLPDWSGLPNSLKIAAITIGIGSRATTRYVYYDGADWFVNRRPIKDIRSVAWSLAIKDYISLRHPIPVDVSTSLAYICAGKRYCYNYTFTRRCLRRVAKTMQVVMEGLLHLNEDVDEDVHVSPRRVPPRPERHFHRK